MLLYTIYENLKRSYSYTAYANTNYLNALKNFEYFWGESVYTNCAQALSQSVNQLIKDYPKPRWNLPIKPQVILQKTFCDLILFTDDKTKPPLIVCAPLSGHWATLLKDTIAQCTQNFSVYVTDWKNSRDIAYYSDNQIQDFSFDNYVEYILEFFAHIKATENREFTAVAVCQPTVPVLVAAAYLSQTHQFDSLPRNLVLMGGPVDTRKSPTSVNEYAKQHDIKWFEQHVIHTVPAYYKGVGRAVYPGFLQYMGFVSMNLDKHIQSHWEFFNHLMQGADLKAQRHIDFYDEYNSVMDLPATYYLQTLQKVFLEHQLPKGVLEFKNIKINLGQLKNIKLMAIEGELDDISGKEQTKSALDLAVQIPGKDKAYFLAPNVGHYGIFAGSTWKNVIYPEIKKFTRTS